MEKNEGSRNLVESDEEIYIEPEAEVKPESGHGKMPWFLLMIWTVNVIFYIYYFMRYGLPNLEEWLNR